MYNGSKVLITGGLGFIGSNMALALADAGADVTILDNQSRGGGCNTANLDGDKRIKVRIEDIANGWAMRSSVTGMDYLFNLASSTSHAGSMADPIEDINTNAVAQLTVLESCRTHNPAIKIVYTSTRQVYGRPGSLPVTEMHPARPCDANGVSKLAAEHYHRLYHEVHGVRSCILRLTNTYGPRMRIKDGNQGFIGLWMRRIIEGQPFEVWDGTQTRDFCYVDDCVKAIMLAGADCCMGETYNIGGNVCSLRKFANQAAEIGGGTFIVREFPEDRKRIDIGSYWADYSKFTQDTGWRHTTSNTAGIRKTLKYFNERKEVYL